MDYTIYVLEDNLGAMYIGLTRDLQRRLNDHLSGRGKTTKKMNFRKLKLRHNWTVKLYSNASRFERYLHSITKSEVLDLILDCPFWNKFTEELAHTKILQHSEKLIDAGGRFQFYENDLVSLPNKDQLSRVI